MMNRAVRSAVIVALSLAYSGCASKVDIIARYAEYPPIIGNVEVYDQDFKSGLVSTSRLYGTAKYLVLRPGDYHAVADLEIVIEGEHSEQRAVNGLTRKARELGADAIILVGEFTEWRPGLSSRNGMPSQFWQRIRRLRALAVRYSRIDVPSSGVAPTGT